MKKFYLVLALCLSATFGFSQGYYLLPSVDAGFNPGNLNNDPEQPEAFLSGNNLGWTTVLSSNANDEWSAVQTVPFPFNFNGSPESSFVVSGSGVVTFISAQPSMTPGFSNTALPSSSLMDKSICAWGLNVSGANDAVLSKTFGTAPNRQHWIVWSSASAPGLGTGAQWAYWGIVLEETTNSIYIVDMRSYSAGNTNSAMTVGIQIDATTAISVAGSPNLGSTTLATGGGTSDASDNTFYEFVYGTQPANDLRLISVNVPNQVALNSSSNFTATIQNRGSNAVSSFDYNYDDNAGLTGTNAYSGNLASGGYTTINASPAWVPTTAGAYSVDFSVTNTNGGTDDNPADNSLTYNTSAAVAAQRVPLYETFTSSTCPPCRPANATMKGIFDANGDDYVSVKYQVNWPGTGDPYFTNEVGARRNYYGVTAVPTVFIDGGWGENGNSLTQAVFDQYQSVLSFVELSAEFEVDANTQTVSGDVKVKPLTALNGANLHIAIIETRTVQNVKTNGETEFFNVMKKMVPNENGKPMGALAADVEVTESFSYTFNGNYVLPPNANAPANLTTEHTVESFNALGLAVWLQDPGTQEVFQAARGKRSNFVGARELSPLAATLYPNPAKDYIHIELDAAQELQVVIKDLSGKVVLSRDFGLSQNESIYTGDLKTGMYLVTVSADGQSMTERINVLH